MECELAITIGRGKRRATGETIIVDGVEGLSTSLVSHTCDDAWWAPAKFRDHHRRNDLWLEQRVFAVDIDYYDEHGQHAPMPNEFRAVLESGASSAPAALVHTTPRGARLITLLDVVLVDADAHGRVLRVLGDRAEWWLAMLTLPRVDALRVDRSALDRARYFWSPSATIGGAPRAAALLTGSAPSTALADLLAESTAAALRAKLARAPEPSRATAPKARERASNRRAAYVEAVIQRAASDVASAPEGARNNALFARACTAFEFALGPDGRGDVDRVRAEFESAGLAAGLSRAEISDTLQSAERQARIAPKAVPDLGPSSADAPPPSSPPASTPRLTLVHGGGNGDGFGDGDGDVELIGDGATPAKCAENVARLLCGDPAWGGGPRHDTFAGAVVWPAPLPELLQGLAREGGAYVDADIHVIQGWLLSQAPRRRVRASVEMIDGGVRLAAARRAYDSLTAHVEALPAWDGVERLSPWLARYMGATDTVVTRRTGRAWLCSAVARALRPGCVADGVLVLEGAEGSGKNYAIETLFGREFVRGLGSVALGSRDAAQVASSAWVIHDDEFRSRGAKQRDQLFSWLSAMSETHVLKYAKTPSTLTRRAVLVCSINRDGDYLGRGTNRRFWPVETGRIDVDALFVDRRQLLAEALAAVRGGERWTIGRGDSAWTAIADDRAERVEDNPLAERIQTTMTTIRPGERILVAEVMRVLGVPPERMIAQMREVGQALRDLGWSRSKDTAGRRWWSPPAGW